MQCCCHAAAIPRDSSYGKPMQQNSKRSTLLKKSNRRLFILAWAFGFSKPRRLLLRPLRPIWIDLCPTCTNLHSLISDRQFQIRFMSNSRRLEMKTRRLQKPKTTFSSSIAHQKILKSFNELRRGDGKQERETS
jgi:hypothetical protein